MSLIRVSSSWICWSTVFWLWFQNKVRRSAKIYRSKDNSCL